MLYDTHAHLDDRRLFSDLAGVLQRATEAGVGLINTVGCDWRSSLLAVHLAEKHPDQLRAVVGVHPSELDGFSDQLLERLLGLAKSPLVVAWGETGLDYHYPDTLKRQQKQAFRLQINAAREAGLPLVIHDRDAHQDLLQMLKAEKAGSNGGVMHCFSGSWEMAKECLNLGFHISFAGPLTFANAKTPVEVAARVPLDRLLVETDCPYLSPHPFRGKLNEPARVAYTAARLAEVRGLDYEELAALTTANGRQLFLNKH